MGKEVKALLYKDIVLEWRHKYAMGGIILYLISTVFICYICFKLKTNDLDPVVWNTLFWIIMLFTAINAVIKSFMQERNGRQLYLFQIASAESIIISKLIFNFLLLLFITAIGFIVYSAFLGYFVQNTLLYVFTLFLGALGFSSCLTLMAGIASKADNPSSLMAILSFPILIPSIIMLMGLSKNAMDGIPFSFSYDEILVLLGIDLIVIALSYILFPYLWKS